MANPEHLAILKQGVEVWNEWRDAHPTTTPRLDGADLRHRSFAGRRRLKRFYEWDFIDVDFRYANLRFTNFAQANCAGANFSYAGLHGADFTETYLADAKLTGACLQWADLYFTNLKSADLSGSTFIWANLRQCDLTDADFSGAEMAGCVLGELDLSTCKGLADVKHTGPSVIGIDSIFRSRGNIPLGFLKGAGVPDVLIEQMKALVGAMEPIQFYSCFISYSSKDQAFAERTHNDLQSEGVRCWFAPEDLKIGDPFRQRIDESIRLHDKLLLILSEHSVNSPWVQDEVEAALERECIGPDGVDRWNGVSKSH